MGRPVAASVVVGTRVRVVAPSLAAGAARQPTTFGAPAATTAAAVPDGPRQDGTSTTEEQDQALLEAVPPRSLLMTG